MEASSIRYNYKEPYTISIAPRSLAFTVWRIHAARLPGCELCLHSVQAAKFLFQATSSVYMCYELFTAFILSINYEEAPMPDMSVVRACFAAFAT